MTTECTNVLFVRKDKTVLFVMESPSFNNFWVAINVVKNPVLDQEFRDRVNLQRPQLEQQFLELQRLNTARDRVVINEDTLETEVFFTKVSYVSPQGSASVVPTLAGKDDLKTIHNSKVRRALNEGGASQRTCI